MKTLESIFPRNTPMAESTFGERVERSSAARPAAIGTVVMVSHGRCCGEAATVIAGTAHTFTAVACCGWKFQAQHTDGYRVLSW